MNGPLLWLSLLLCAPDVRRLAGDDFATRAAAAERLAALGPLAWPALADAADGSGDAEVRRCCRDLLPRCRIDPVAGRAFAVLTGLEAVSEDELLPYEVYLEMGEWMGRAGLLRDGDPAGNSLAVYTTRTWYEAPALARACRDRAGPKGSRR